ncbi:MAG: FG-GAP repeat protein [Spirochaetales bacterium]|nr:FG-GAP repeat protein [Spirochaetales bacterium]
MATGETFVFDADTFGLGYYRIDVTAYSVDGSRAGSATAETEAVAATAGGNREQVAKLLAADGTANDWFGNSVSISDDTAIVGAHWDDDAGTNQDDDGGNASGSVYIYTNYGSDNWSEAAKLTASDAAEDDNFGYSVSISDDTAIIGAYRDDDGVTTDTGAAYLFTLR